MNLGSPKNSTLTQLQTQWNVIFAKESSQIEYNFMIAAAVISFFTEVNA